MEHFELNNQWISLESLEFHIQQKHSVQLGSTAREAIEKGYHFLHQKLKDEQQVYYGINTGFGSLCNTRISSYELQQLQLNLLRSHACGLGNQVPKGLVKRMLLLKAISLAKGHSGVQLATVERLLFFYNHDILPVVYEQGSLGASGDLAPLAHLSLPLIGEGEVLIENNLVPAGELKERYGIEPIQLHAKEGLALLNGTQFMGAYGTHCIHCAQHLFHQGLRIATLSLEAYDGRHEPFQANVHALRNQSGQIKVAEQIRNCLSPQRAKNQVQDPYSFRCIPQVHGASLDVLEYTATVFERELNAVTDNPTLFPEEDQIISAGNFHGQPLALSLDFLSIAMAELGSIAERRIYKLISGTRDLPPFLVQHAGLNSGFMIVQYTAASMVSQNKQLCTPASVDTIDSSNGQEDHVSMGANAATKGLRIIENVCSITAMEWLTAAQAFDYRKGWELSPEIQALYDELRENIPFMEHDRYMHQDLQKSIDLLKKQFKNTIA